MFLLSVGCNLASSPTPTSTSVPPTPTPLPPTPTATATPIPPTPTPIPSITEITTSAGDVVITKVEIVSEDLFGNKAAPDYQILLIWFESADGTEIDGGDFFEARKGVYVTADDGSKSESYMGGLDAGKLFVGFTPPTVAHKFVLHWFDNPPIELELGQ